uniref:PH domain-containing protein n=1 Tax=Ditylenchus dipsaci TaxID=166011 RepID=A0A915DGF7_9BILA
MATSAEHLLSRRPGGVQVNSPFNTGIEVGEALKCELKESRCSIVDLQITIPLKLLLAYMWQKFDVTRFPFGVFDNFTPAKNKDLHNTTLPNKKHSNPKDIYDISDSSISSDVLYDPVYQRLFRLFLLFSADTTEKSVSQRDSVAQQTNLLNKNGRLLSFITTEQAKYLVNQMAELLDGLHKAETKPCNHSQHQNPYKFPEDKMTFREVVDCCRTLFPLRRHLESVVDSLFERYIQQVVRKGFLMCRKVRDRQSNKCSSCFSSSKSLHTKVTRAGRWRSYWCILLPGNICLWPLNKAEKASRKHRKRLFVDHNAEIEVGAFDGDRFVWEVRTKTHCFQFAHFDELQRQMWISDMEIIVNNCHRILLESENKRLVTMLDSERKALYDEEIVRQLATRMLDEEAERSNNFQRTIQFLSEELEYERSHRLFLEKRLYEAVEIAEQSAMHEPLHYEDSGLGMEHEKRPPLDYLIISTQSV